METSRDHQVPDFQITPFHLHEDGVGSYDMLQVRCPRPKCPSPEFWVRRTWAVIRPYQGRADDPPAFVIGRNCPSCSRVSLIPEEHRIKFEPKRRKRVVRVRKRKT